jgi:hypothetical protein
MITPPTSFPKKLSAIGSWSNSMVYLLARQQGGKKSAS